MIIEKNGFYDLSSSLENNIEIKDWLNVSFFDNWNVNRDVFLWEKSKVFYYWLLENKENNIINFNQNKEWSFLNVKYLLLSKDKQIVKSKIYSKISSDNSESDVKIVSIIWNDWNIDLDGIIEIDKWFIKIKWNLTEENLFLWNTWKVRWIPTLLVRSDDVEAGHACKIERISDEKLFYLRSRWISRNNALNLIIESNIKSVLWGLSSIDNDFYEILFEKTLQKIN